jgi:S1-C subfamily serine protease
MRKQSPTFGIKFMIFWIYFIGFGLHVWVLYDITFSPSTSNTTASVTPSKNFLENAKKSVLFIQSGPCGSEGEKTGTGFIIQPGYVATNAHVVKDAEKCDKYHLIDYLGKTHTAKLKAISSSVTSSDSLANFSDDFAILQFEDESHNLPPLEFANSSEYEVNHELEKVMTIGFPAFASTPGKASTSSTGNISNFDTTKNLFITSGMNLNSGNSGGPVFLCKNYKVVGVAVAVLRGQITPDTAPIEGISYFIPINKLKNFALEKLNIKL